MSSFRLATASFIAMMLVFVASSERAKADSVTETVSVNTNSFAGSGNTFEIYVQLTEGTGDMPGDNNNTLSLADFNLGGGAAGTVDTVNTFNATGDMTGSVSMSDTQPYSYFAEFFTPGTALTFTLSDAFTIVNPSEPDGFFFALIENGAPLNTTDPTGNGNLFSVTFDSSSPTAAAYTDLNSADSVGTPEFTGTPEPPALVLYGFGLLLIGALGMGQKFRQTI
jgi:hypothetical protein